MHTALADDGLLDKELYLAQRLRVGPNYRGRRHYNGLHWFSNTGSHVWYESMMERRALIWLDYTQDIVAIASQPMLMHFPDGTNHYPDFIALHADGHQMVYNVKPGKFITGKVTDQFANTTELCKRVGWEHHVISEFVRPAIGTIEFLANFRQNHFAPTADMRHHLLEQLTGSKTVRHTAQLLSELPSAARVPAIYHLAWYGYLILDLTAPLSMNTPVRKALA